MYFTVEFDWFTGSFVSLVIGQSVDFAFGLYDTRLETTQTDLMLLFVLYLRLYLFSQLEKTATKKLNNLNLTSLWFYYGNLRK